MHSYPKDVTSSTRNEIQNKKIKAIVFNKISRRFSLKSQLPKTKLYVSVKKLISDHTKDGKTSFDSADGGKKVKTEETTKNTTGQTHKPVGRVKWITLQCISKHISSKLKNRAPKAQQRF